MNGLEFYASVRLMKNLYQDKSLTEYGLQQIMQSSEPFLKQTLQLASLICDTPVAYISILGDKYQYVIHQIGSDFELMLKEQSICQHTVKQEGILVIPDTKKDIRTNSLQITQETVGFYAGVPLIDEDDKAIGAFCVTDATPRNIDDKQKEVLDILAKQVVSYLTLRKSAVQTVSPQEYKNGDLSYSLIGLFDKLRGLHREVKEKNESLELSNKLIQEKIHELTSILHTFPGSVARVSKDYIYEFANQRYFDWAGLEPEQVQGMHVRDLIGDASFQKLKPIYDKVLKGEHIVHEGIFDFKNVKKILRVNYFPVYNLQKVEAIYVFTEDLTSIRSYQSQLENSNKNLESFAYMVSHDIKSPLRTIRSFGTLLQKDLNERAIAYPKEYLDIIVDASLQLNTLTTDLLDFAKINQGKKEEKSLKLLSILETVQLNLHDLIADKHAQIRYQLSDETIKGQRTDFILLFQNLISNAIKYSKKEVPPIIEITLDKTEEGYKCTVKDNGLGIPSDKQEEIFEPFKRIDGDDRAEGTGIGLATCQKIIKKYNSVITLTSEVDRGSSFSFVLPFGN